MKDAIHFGTGYAYELPSGWKLIENADDWAFGISPDGDKYFLGDGKAFPCKVAGPDNEHILEGEEYIELESGVIEF